MSKYVQCQYQLIDWQLHLVTTWVRKYSDRYGIPLEAANSERTSAETELLRSLSVPDTAAAPAASASASVASSAAASVRRCGAAAAASRTAAYVREAVSSVEGGLSRLDPIISDELLVSLYSDIIRPSKQGALFIYDRFALFSFGMKSYILEEVVNICVDLMNLY
ncbi:unnamed protein product [Angiostrongylus costaricensis]|uniref:Uncharacterized protein n=1 Tax=Angiostrongylus costaricensis TaxID=334426 RepID=A0A0R3PU28_ANGCS|nr:unnamed protein product [Angiostrongylus costaricensis]